jgi:myo-inositol-1(or 4)-monophosphatase
LSQGIAAPDWPALIAAAEAAADVAGCVIRPFFRAVPNATLKSDRSPVTIADRTAEQVMRTVLSQRFPRHGILGEEFGLERAEARLRWVLDPIDGTRAFITGRPLFGTLIGLLDGDRPILGVIDQPITGERWIGVTGHPTTYRSAFGGRIGTRICPRLGDAELSCTSPEMFTPGQAARWERLSATTGRRTFGGDCYAYGLLALGQLDIIAEADLKIWDWAALLPVITGAGGMMTNWDGDPLRADGDGTALTVGNPALLTTALAALVA